MPSSSIQARDQKARQLFTLNSGIGHPQEKGHPLRMAFSECSLMIEALEEETRRCLHRAWTLRACDLAKAIRGGERCVGSNLGHRERRAWRREVGVVDDVERVDTELEVQGFEDSEVLRNRGIKVSLARR